MFFPTIVLGTINGILNPICTGTSALLQHQTFDMQAYQRQREELKAEAQRQNPENILLGRNEEFDKAIEDLSGPSEEMTTLAEMYCDIEIFSLQSLIRSWFRELLDIIFQAASLVIDTLRTFFLIVLAILGPIAFALSVYDGLHNTLTAWLARYISIYLWLPVSDLFGCILSRIQTLMFQHDIAEQTQNPFFVINDNSVVYIIFLIIGIVGYFAVPTVSNWIIQGGGVGVYGHKVNSVANTIGGVVSKGAGAVTGNVSGRLMGRGK